MMSLTADLNVFIDRLTLAATSAPDEASARRNIQELAAALHGHADRMDARLKHGSFDVGGRPAPFERKP
jgi:hypothetical protein